MIDSCYNSGEIVAKGYDIYSSTVGGIAGISTHEAIIRNCYNYGNTVQQNTGLIGGITARVTSGSSPVRNNN